MSDPGGAQEVRRERVLLAAAVALAVVAPAAVWRIGRMSEQPAPDAANGGRMPGTGEDAGTATGAPRAAGTPDEPAGTPVAPPSPTPANAPRRRRDATPDPGAARRIPTRKRRRDPGTPTAEP